MDFYDFKELVYVFLIILVTFILAALILIIIGIIIALLHYNFIFKIKYADKEFTCFEDDEVSFNTTIERSFKNHLIYFENEHGNIQTLGTDGNIYTCRGMSIIK